MRVQGYACVPLLGSQAMEEVHLDLSFVHVATYLVVLSNGVIFVRVEAAYA
jgi:hypothetical protein